MLGSRARVADSKNMSISSRAIILALAACLAGSACSRVHIYRGHGGVGRYHVERSDSRSATRSQRRHGESRNQLRPSRQPIRGRQIVAIAQRYLGVPYRFGGKSPRTGFDCSGFTGYVYSRAGMRLPAGARAQFRGLTPVRYPAPGDLVFFRTSGSRISHVGIYAGNLQFVHAPRTGKTVEVTSMNNRYWRKRYAGARTFAGSRQ